MSDPSTETWRAALAHTTVTNSWDTASTSAQLRSAELEIEGVREELTRQAATNEDLQATLAMRTRALAASQQDLSRVEAERDTLAVLNAELKAEAAHWRENASARLNEKEQP